MIWFILLLILFDYTITYYLFFLISKKTKNHYNEEKGLVARLVLKKFGINSISFLINIFVAQLVIFILYCFSVYKGFGNETYFTMIGMYFIILFGNIHVVADVEKQWNNNKYWEAYNILMSSEVRNGNK